MHRLIKHVDINKKHRIRRVFPFVLLDIVLVNLKCLHQGKEELFIFHLIANSHREIKISQRSCTWNH